MKDIYDVTGIKIGIIDDLYFFPALLFLLLILFGYISYRMYLYRKFKNSAVEEIEKIKKKLEDLSKQKFYEAVNQVFRKYFIYRGVEEAQIYTYTEIKKHQNRLSKKSMKLFFETYHLEFNQAPDSSESRQEILSQLIKVL